ncbi:heterokaryon incompatibility protein-domain-containing protein [Hypomontagnella monticulosa]|nr:heterokaryon incompatibility protein-domain-containing protein [Hypomontagnella monticulosa]
MDQPTETQEPGIPHPAGFPRELQGSSFYEIDEEMPEDLQLNLPGPLLDEMTKSIFDTCLQATVDESHEVVPDEVFETILDEFNRTQPDDIPQPPRKQALRAMRYTFIKQHIDNDPDIFSDCRQTLLRRYRKLKHDKYRQFIRDRGRKSLADGFPHEGLKIWRRLYSESTEKFLALKPDVDEMCLIALQVQTIVRLLCKRDRRFSFICSALKDLLNGHDGLHNFRTELDRIIFTDPNELEDVVEIDVLSKIIASLKSFHKCDPADYMCSKHALREIIDSTIYELLNVFGEGITLAQSSIGTSLSKHFELLRDLHIKSQSLEPRPAIQVASEHRRDNGNRKSYQYPTCLNSSIGGIRVLKILPGTSRHIECCLVVRNLYNDDISEALSYVWGTGELTESISVDGKPFEITENLFRILRGLRRPNTTREIWIDAICINQSDAQEKTDQVSLMKDIYSSAKSTVVWLSDGHTEDPRENQRQDQPFNMEGLYAPIPAKVGGVDVDQYDLAAILREAQKYSIDDPWSEKQWLLYSMLRRCTGLVLLHSWWERIWTVQEAGCPPNAPIFFFRGYSFSFDDFTGAVNIVIKMVSGSEHVTRQLENRHNVIGPEVWQVVSTINRCHIGLLSSGPLLFRYRRGSEGKRDPAAKSLAFLLAMTGIYRATDPRDKIFALQSLLHKCSGLLINVDYKEHCEAVFRRVTARTYNAGKAFHMAGLYRFWFESPLSTRSPAGPSWVIDYTYNDASHRKNKYTCEANDKATLDGFILEKTLTHMELESDVNDAHFCTPNVLFCTGRYISEIYSVGVIPKFSDTTIHIAFDSLAFFTRQVFNARESLLSLPVTTKFLSDDGNLKFLSLAHFFLMQKRVLLPSEPKRRDEFISARNEELAGKPIFITEKGLVGIATAPIEPGDFLSWIHGSSVYTILREVKHGDGSPDASRKHQIVARAAVHDELVHDAENMEALIDSIPSRHFEIV